MVLDNRKDQVRLGPQESVGQGLPVYLREEDSKLGPKARVTASHLCAFETANRLDSGE